MGLDFLEVAYEIEEDYGIELPEAEIQGLIRDRDIRVGDLYDLILAKLGLQDTTRNSVTLNAALWREMQKVLSEVTGVPNTELTLQSPLAELFPRETRREDWSELQAVSPFRIRELDYSPWLRVLALAMTTILAFVEIRGIWQNPLLRWLGPFLGFLCLWMVVETHLKLLKFLKPWRSNLPLRIATTKHLCRDVLASDYAQVSRYAEVAIDPRCLDVWHTLQRILSEALGVEAEEINFRSQLVRDLGMA